MGAVALNAPTRASWADLLAAGVALDVDAIAARVGVTGPKGPATTARAEIVWRRDAMLAAWRTGQRTTLLAVVGLRVVDRAFCLSCADRMPRGDAGDCKLCIAARVLALRDVGVLVARSPYTPPPPPERHERAPVAPLPHSPPEPWACVRCGTRVEGLYRDPDGECGRCELARISTMDMSRVSGPWPVPGGRR